MVYVYTLFLEQNKYYVGKTDNPRFRIDSHFDASGSAWTKKYPPLKLLELIPDCDHFDEDKYTKVYMNKYGINNVRGGSFCQIKLPQYQIDSLKKELDTATDRCYICGETGHYANKCSKFESYSESDSELKYDSWKYDSWECSYCGKLFDTLKGAKYHENVYCKKKLALSKNKTKSNTKACYRCGRNGHFSNNCYASKHIKGYY